MNVIVLCMGMKQTKLARGKYLSNLKNIPDRRQNQASCRDAWTYLKTYLAKSKKCVSKNINCLKRKLYFSN